MKLNWVEPFVKFLPEISQPARPVKLKEKIVWTAAGLIIFFVMYHVFPIGVIVKQGASFEFLQVVTASRVGSLITAGIGPIILASIFLQLFIGAKIIDINMRDPVEKKHFQVAQKLLAIVLSFFEAAVYILSGSVQVVGAAGSGTLPLFGSPLVTEILVIFQLAMGSIILLYLDEIISKYGIGSGISLFIAAGVSLAVVQGTVFLLFNEDRGALAKLQGGGADAIPQALLALLPLAFTAAVFLASTYAEGMKVEIPLSFERARGFMGRFPIKFLYVSNIPVILASALMLNLQLWMRALIGKAFYVGGVDILPYIANVGPNGVSDGLLYFITPIFFSPLAAGYDAYFALLSSTTPVTGLPEWLHVVTYMISLVILCVIFGRFWIETTGMSARDVSEQLNQSGLQVPGFRRDPRVVEGVLNKYIPTITILGSIFVGLLAGFADLTGALGTGTGILLTVGILHKLYEDLTAQHLFDLYPDLKKFVG